MGTLLTGWFLPVQILFGTSDHEGPGVFAGAFCFRRSLFEERQTHQRARMSSLPWQLGIHVVRRSGPSGSGRRHPIRANPPGGGGAEPSGPTGVRAKGGWVAGSGVPGRLLCVGRRVSAPGERRFGQRDDKVLSKTSKPISRCDDEEEEHEENDLVRGIDARLRSGAAPAR